MEIYFVRRANVLQQWWYKYKKVQKKEKKECFYIPLECHPLIILHLSFKSETVKTYYEVLALVSVGLVLPFLPAGGIECTPWRNEQSRPLHCPPGAAHHWAEGCSPCCSGLMLVWTAPPTEETVGLVHCRINTYANKPQHSNHWKLKWITWSSRYSTMF